MNTNSPKPDSPQTQLYLALQRLRTNAQRIFDKVPVRDWAETLAEADAALEAYSEPIREEQLSDEQAVLNKTYGDGIKDAARIASLFSVKPGASIHPDIPWEKMNETAKMIAHTTAQQISWAILESAPTVPVEDLPKPEPNPQPASAIELVQQEEPRKPHPFAKTRGSGWFWCHTPRSQTQSPRWDVYYINAQWGANVGLRYIRTDNFDDVVGPLETPVDPQPLGSEKS